MASEPPQSQTPNLFYYNGPPFNISFDIHSRTHTGRHMRAVLARARRPRRRPKMDIEEYLLQYTTATFTTPKCITKPPAHLAWLPPGFFSGSDAALLMTVLQPKLHYRKLLGLAFRDLPAQFGTGLVLTPPALIELQERAIGVTILYRRLRHAFKRLLHAFLARKIAARSTVDDDPITLEPIQKPVYITDMAGRWRYAFEASTIFNSIRAQLRHCYYGWPSPVAPRNPCTNSPLKWQQIWSVRQQLIRHGLACWELEAFVERSMKLDTFTRGFGVALHQEMQVRELAAREATDGCEALVDFILEMGEYTDVDVDYSHINAFKLAFADPVGSTHPYVVAWKMLYTRYILNCPQVSLDSSAIAYFNTTAHKHMQISARAYLRVFGEFYRDFTGDNGV
jgi:hypothetical protein